MAFSQHHLVVALALLSVLVLSAAPAGAHEDHNRQQESEQLQPPSTPGAAMPPSVIAAHDRMGEMMDAGERERSSMPFVARLLDWLGRFHPTIVHFPIAFFPAALFTAIVGRRRSGFAVPVQFLVVAGGIIAPVAALLGWLDALSAEPGSLLMTHRWLGTAIGVVGLILALWAWRRPGDVRGIGMIAALSIITAAIVVQAWYGGAMVHGIGHLNW